MKIDGKHTVWQRIEINDAEAEKALLEFIAENPSVGFSEIYDWAVKNGIDPECEKSHPAWRKTREFKIVRVEKTIQEFDETV